MQHNSVVSEADNNNPTIEITKQINRQLKSEMVLKTWVEVRPYEQICVSLGHYRQPFKSKHIGIKVEPWQNVNDLLTAQLMFIEADQSQEAFVQIANYGDVIFGVEIWLSGSQDRKAQ